jgi:hypothetical protein
MDVLTLYMRSEAEGKRSHFNHFPECGKCSHSHHELSQLKIRKWVKSIIMQALL